MGWLDGPAKKKNETWKYLVIVFVGLVTAGVVYGLTRHDLATTSTDCSENNISPSAYDVKLSPSSKKSYNLEYAKTTPQQELGLSDRPCLPDNGALLFLFPTDDKFGIWMKNMNFPIDVVWLDSNKKIVTIQKDMEPSTYPKIFYPDMLSRYVIEFKKGAVDDLKIQVGSALNW